MERQDIMYQNMAKQYWIMKTEPSEFSIADLEKQGTALWDGVRNYQVRNMFRDKMKIGDLALLYHSSTDVIGVVGEMQIIKPDEIDPTQFKVGHKYYDVKSSPQAPRWLAPVVKYVRTFRNIVTLAEIKSRQEFSKLPLVKKGNRLSVINITKLNYQALIALASKKR